MDGERAWSAAPHHPGPDVLWDHIGIGFLAKVFSGDPRYSNPVGALPSLHAAYPLLFVLLFWGVASRRWRIALVGYTLAMAFVLVYFAEHYVFDVWMGWAYAAIAFAAVGAVVARRAVPGAEGLPTETAAHTEPAQEVPSE